MRDRLPVNRTMSREELAHPCMAAIVASLNDTVRWCQARGLAISSWFGCLEPGGALPSYERQNRGLVYEPLEAAADDARFPWFLYWEIAWALSVLRPMTGCRLLDLGGASSLFSFHLGLRGIEVTTVDVNAELVDHANMVAAATGWPLTNICDDAERYVSSQYFDYVTAICVYEHLPVATRVNVSRALSTHLRPGGRFACTFDYQNPSMRAAITSPADVSAQIAEPSGLQIVGNRMLYDNRERYLLHPYFHPEATTALRAGAVAAGEFAVDTPPWPVERGLYTFGSLALQKARE